MLRVSNLEVYYGNVRALERVSLYVNQGELVTLIGSNGAGKTTFLMTLCGIIRPRAGTIEFLGTRLDKLPSHAIVGLGIAQVPQGRMLFPDMTVSENLELGACQAIDVKSKGIEHKIEEIYTHFEVLKERKSQRAGTLSGGEQQMLAIGRGLMASPKLLLLDEPSSGLAPLIVEHLIRVISDLSKGGLSILLVEQNARLALEVADRGYVLERGRIILEGKAKDLQRDERVKKAYLGEV